MEQNEVKRFPASGGGPVRAKLIERLKDGKIGDIVTDAELTQVCGVATGVRGKAYPALMKAIRYVTRNHAVVWERIHSADAIQCLDTDGIITTADKSATHVRRTAVKTVQKLRTVSLNDIEESKRSPVLSRMAQHGALSMFAKHSMQTKLETASKSSPPTPQQLLQLFK